MEFSITTLSHLNNYEIVTESGCHIFMGAINSKGYGSIRIGCKTYLAHRLSYEFHKNKIKPFMYILHSCDITCCINPEHLREGTQQNNMDDRMKRNKYKSIAGCSNPNTKLTDADVLAIKNGCFKTSYYMKKYNLKKHAINNIKAGRTWGHLDNVNG